MDLVKAQVGQTVRVLVEGCGRNEGTLSGRLDNNLTVEFAADPALTGSYAQAQLANCITLTPGTMTMEITEEDGQTYNYVHWIDVTADGEEAGNIIKGTMEKWLRRIWK